MSRHKANTSNKQKHRDSSSAQPCRGVKAGEGATRRKPSSTHAHNEIVFCVQRNDV